MQMIKRVRAVLRALTPASAVFVVALGSVWSSSVAITSAPALAKTPGSTYCFYGKCHRVKTLSEMRALEGASVTLHSSHYDSCHRDRYNPCGLTSSGEPFFADRPDNAASPIYPDGTKLLVWSPLSKEAAVVRINNAGPYWGNRKLDVSRSLARKLGFERRGVAKLQIRILSAPTRSEARYKRNRRYAKVKGPIGKFESLDQAEKGLAVLLAFEAMTTAAIAPAGGAMVGQVKRPFEVAAKATQGRAFAEVRPELKTWPVVARRFASIDWPVVGQVPARAKKAPVQVAALNGSPSNETSTQGRELKTWPVVAEPDPRQDAQRQVRLADAGSIVQELVGRQKTEQKRASQAAETRARPKKPLRAATPKRRLRVARLRKARASKVQKRKLARARQSRARSKYKRKANGKLSRYATARARAKAKRTAKIQVRRATPPRVRERPHVATRQILHRALGRGA